MKEGIYALRHILRNLRNCRKLFHACGLHLIDGLKAAHQRLAAGFTYARDILKDGFHLRFAAQGSA